MRITFHLKTVEIHQVDIFRIFGCIASTFVKCFVTVELAFLI